MQLVGRCANRTHPRVDVKPIARAKVYRKLGHYRTLLPFLHQRRLSVLPAAATLSPFARSTAASVVAGVGVADAGAVLGAVKVTLLVWFHEKGVRMIKFFKEFA